MRIKIVEKTTGIGIVTESCIELALQKSMERKVAPDNMQFVVGEPDVEIYEYASNWVGMYRWLTNYFRKQSSQQYFIEAAESRFQLWQAIARSRVVNRESDVAPQLSTVMGKSLAADVNLLMRLDRKSDCKIYGPDVKRSWAEAYEKAAAFSRRYDSRNYVLAIHEALGAIIVAPDYMIALHPAFKIKRDFVRGRSL